MVCIYCGSGTSVVNSRLQRRSNHIWRRRKCLVCSGIVTTEEHIALANAVMVKAATGKLRPFSRDQLFVSIYESCKHRSSGADDATALTLVIIGDLLGSMQNGILERNDIVRAAHTVLARLDPAAATFYGAYHPAR